jgi:hypothetical protein
MIKRIILNASFFLYPCYDMVIIYFIVCSMIWLIACSVICRGPYIPYLIIRTIMFPYILNHMFRFKLLYVPCYALAHIYLFICSMLCRGPYVLNHMFRFLLSYVPRYALAHIYLIICSVLCLGPYILNYMLRVMPWPIHT